jgi:hypothetical protein
LFGAPYSKRRESIGTVAAVGRCFDKLLRTLVKFAALDEPALQTTPPPQANCGCPQRTSRRTKKIHFWMFYAISPLTISEVFILNRNRTSLENCAKAQVIFWLDRNRTRFKCR